MRRDSRLPAVCRSACHRGAERSSGVNGQQCAGLIESVVAGFPSKDMVLSDPVCVGPPLNNSETSRTTNANSHTHPHEDFQRDAIAVHGVSQILTWQTIDSSDYVRDLNVRH